MAKLVFVFIAILFCAAEGTDPAPPKEPTEQPIDALLLGKFELVSDPGSKDYKNYLDALHVAPVFEQVLTKLKLNIEITKNGSEYHYKVVTPFAIKELSFQPDHYFSDTFLDTRGYNTSFKFIGKDTVVQDLIFDNSQKAQNKYVFTKEGMTAQLKVKNVTAERKYKRVDEFSPDKADRFTRHGRE